jgi:hypothetical protein
VRAGEAEQGIIGAEGFLEADENLSEAIDPAMTDFNDPAAGHIIWIVFLKPTQVVLGLGAGLIAVIDHQIPCGITDISGIRVHCRLHHRIGNDGLNFC